MIRHNVVQSTKEWHELRAKHFTASEAAAMMGVSKYTSRQQLLHEKATGQAPEFTPSQLRIFARGHAAEAGARPIVAKIVGDDLFPVTGTSEEHPHLLASLDGITMLGDIVFEHKLWNEALAENVRNDIIEPHYFWQLEQQLLVSGAEKAIFVVSDGTEANMVWMWYEPVPERRQDLLAGWEQFAKDLAEYKPEAKQELVEAEEVYLPALSARVDGTMVVSNIVGCLPQLRTLAETEISKPLETDLDFANKEQLIRSVKTTREKLKVLTEATIANFDSLQEFKDAAGEADRILQQLQSHSEKLVKARKEEIKQQIIIHGENALNAHIGELNIRLDKVMLPAINADFGSAIKGKKKLDNMKDAVADTLAKAKIEANRIAVAIEDNLKVLASEAEDYEFLFSDLQQVITKDHADFINLVKARVIEHQQAEEARLTAERERIRQEEIDRLEDEKRADEAAKLAEERRIAQEAEQQAAKAEQQVDLVEVIESQPYSPTAGLGQLAPAQAEVARSFATQGPNWLPEDERYRTVPAEEPVKTITIPLAEYHQLLEDRATLHALQAGGVDNWSGYDCAMALLEAEAEPA